MFVTDEDINEIAQLKGIRCTITGANRIYQSGPVTLQKRQQGKELLFYILYYTVCVTVGCCGIRIELELEQVLFRFKLWRRSLCVIYVIGKDSSLP